MSLSRIFDDDTITRLNYESGLVAAAVTVMLIATAPEEFGIPECATSLAAGLEGPHTVDCLIARECLCLPTKRLWQYATEEARTCEA